ncbi:MAG: GNAT family N-acetyltransferase, partial [Pseudomonadota bacterium]
MLTVGVHDVPPGHIAAVVTHLEMPTPAAPPLSLPVGVVLRPVERPDPAWYRDLFRRVGALDWLWFSRLLLTDADLTAILHDPDVEVFALDREGRAEGLLEMDFRPKDGTCELAFLGLTEALQGKGVGAAMVGYGVDRHPRHRPRPCPSH